MNCAEYLVDFLVEHGVTDVFGYAGGYIVPFMEALRAHEGINTHVLYNEQGCAFAAVGYARASGKLGVYFTTSGPGAINGFSGLADAWFDGIPVMGICGNVPTSDFKSEFGIRQKGFQEMDVVPMARHISKLAVTPKNAEEFPSIVARCYRSALSGRKGGVLIDFPQNIQKASIASR